MLEIQNLEDKIRMIGWVQILQDSNVGVSSLKCIFMNWWFSMKDDFAPRRSLVISETFCLVTVWASATGT